VQRGRDNGPIDHFIMGTAATVMNQTFGRSSFLRGVGILDKSLDRMREGMPGCGSLIRAECREAGEKETWRLGSQVGTELERLKLNVER
jgi:hypothetical protein